jgi:nucleotide-binding universal stress UspA family protein
MITFKRILFPVDFSERSAAVVPSVRAMVERFGSELMILHVVDLLPAVGIAPPEAAAWATLMGAERLRENGKIALERFVAREFPGLQVKAESAEGDPATLIVEYARDHQADLIMMPTSGRGPFRRLLLGSVTAKVLHDTATPVWTGAHAAEIAAHSPDRWKHALCAIGNDPHDLPVLRWAAEFACEEKLDLRLVHAVRGAEGCEDDASLQEFLFRVARERIGKLQAAAGTDFEVCMHAGHPAHVVHQAAAGHSADIVIVGRGLLKTALGRLRTGIYEIIRESPCPVISV